MNGPPTPDPMPPRLGLIGLGLLGGAMAERLLSRGFRVLGVDVEPARCAAHQGRGGEVAASACEVAGSCDRILLSLPTGDVAAGVVEQIEPALRPGRVIIDTTTGEPGGAERMGDRLAARGVAYLDATVSGSSEGARRGDVVIMAGGEARAFDACRDVFGALARAAFHVGPCGSGARMKLATNLVLGLNRAALAEGLAFARSLGLDPGLTLAVLREGAAYSRAMDAKGPKMIAGDFAPQARLSQHLKDVRLILAEARRAGAATPLSDVHCVLLEAAEAAGYGEADNSAIFRAYGPGIDRGGPAPA
jgi:3-hydroxyisobutyrate dehydrogenase-like beta-hydroxyacid dehydrogenase